MTKCMGSNAKTNTLFAFYAYCCIMICFGNFEGSLFVLARDQQNIDAYSAGSGSVATASNASSSATNTPSAATSAPSSAHHPVKLAVYDFDGTSINGSSPALLVANLARRKDISLITIWRILLWGAAYKLHLPLHEEHARELVFTAFRGKPKEKVDAYLADFYNKHIAKRFRPAAVRSMKKNSAAGDVVMIVSASFEPIVTCAIKAHPYISYQLSTRMATNSEGLYTGGVEGKPVAGTHKLESVRDFADAQFGKNNWVIDYAFGDHHSDAPLLRAAEHPHAVNPDKTLERIAKENEWPILDWSFSVDHSE